MIWLVQIVVAAVIAFVVTNIDTLFILTIFFSQTDGEFRSRHVILGQYLGFLAIVTLSIIASLGALVMPVEWIGLLGLYPIFLGIGMLIRLRRGPKAYRPVIGWSGTNVPGTSPAFKRMLSVAAVTFGDGGDNISTYVPLFASVGFISTGIILIVFFPLVGLWCYTGYKLGSHQNVTNTIERYGHIIVPFLLVGLGFYILEKAGTLSLVLLG